MGSAWFQKSSLFLDSVSFNLQVKTFEMHLDMKYNTKVRALYTC